MPFTLRQDPTHLRIVLSGCLTDADLVGLADAVIELEALEGFPNRVTDMTGLVRLDIRFPDMLALAERARHRGVPRPIRSALVVADPVQMGFARMFQTLNDHPRVRVEIFPSLETAIAWVQP